MQADITASHADAATAADTDWRQMAALYAELLRFDPARIPTVTPHSETRDLGLRYARID